MALSMNKRRSSWFGQQFSINHLPLPPFSPAISTRNSSSKVPSLPVLPMPEPLFHDAYLVSVEELSPTTPDPRFHTTWKPDYDSDYFGEPDETLEDLGLVMDDEECSIVAKYISITYAGKPRVVDILPQTPSPREEYPRRKAEVVARPPIIWRMPSYDDSSARTSQSSYTMSDRTESLSSTSTSPSSISDECKTPELMACDPTTFPEPQSRPSTPSRAKSLRRHSRNLSASFSKAFLNRLRDIEPVPTMPTSIPDVPPMPAQFLQPNSESRRTLPKSTTLEPPRSKHDMYPSNQPSPQKQAPTLRRKKSLF